LAEAADALKNGNMTVFNKFANDWAAATGNPAPNNFDTIRNAVAGELAKTYKGTGASDEEIGLLTGTVNSSQSPDQLAGSIDYDLRLMGGKMTALRGQYESGLSKDGKPGTPNFPAQPGATPGGAPKHKIRIGNAKTGYKYYTYNGTGDTSNMANYTEVKP
jgi:hypothetical protein